MFRISLTAVSILMCGFVWAGPDANPEQTLIKQHGLAEVDTATSQKIAALTDKFAQGEKVRVVVLKGDKPFAQTYRSETERVVFISEFIATGKALPFVLARQSSIVPPLGKMSEARAIPAAEALADVIALMKLQDAGFQLDFSDVKGIGLSGERMAGIKKALDSGMLQPGPAPGESSTYPTSKYLAQTASRFQPLESGSGDSASLTLELQRIAEKLRRESDPSVRVVISDSDGKNVQTETARGSEVVITVPKGLLSVIKTQDEIAFFIGRALIQHVEGASGKHKRHSVTKRAVALPENVTSLRASASVPNKAVVAKAIATALKGDMTKVKSLKSLGQGSFFASYIAKIDQGGGKTQDVVIRMPVSATTPAVPTEQLIKALGPESRQVVEKALTAAQKELTLPTIEEQLRAQGVYGDSSSGMKVASPLSSAFTTPSPAELMAAANKETGESGQKITGVNEILDAGALSTRANVDVEGPEGKHEAELTIPKQGESTQKLKELLQNMGPIGRQQWQDATSLPEDETRIPSIPQQLAARERYARGDREAEFQADQQAIRLMSEKGFDPKAAASAVRTTELPKYAAGALDAAGIKKGPFHMEAREENIVRADTLQRTAESDAALRVDTRAPASTPEADCGGATSKLTQHRRLFPQD